MEKPVFLNVVPVIDGRTDFAISEILRQRDEVGLTHFLLRLSFHPQTTPARDLIPRLCGQFAAVRDGVAGKGVSLGVLIQSLQGHGWNGKIPLTRETWRHSVTITGAENPRMCLLDPGFRAYALDCVRAIVAERPSTILIDDDFGLRRTECFCPLHVAKVNEVLGTAYSREEMAELLQARPWDDPLAARIVRAIRATAIDFAKDIRAVIDEADPALRCGLCISSTGDSMANEAVHALAGATEPFMRVHDNIYGDVQTDCFPIAFLTACRVMSQLDGVTDILDEADTFPHNYMSVPASAFHSHISMALLSGMTGCKIWTSEYEKPIHTGSQARYEKKLRDYRGFYRELCIAGFDDNYSIGWTGGDAKESGSTTYGVSTNRIIRATLRADGNDTFRLYLGGYKSVGQLTVRDRAGNVKTVAFGDIDTNYYREVTIEAQGGGELEVTYSLLCGSNITAAAVVKP